MQCDGNVDTDTDDQRAQLFKTNDVVSSRDVKISKILYIKILPFFAEKM